VIHAIATLIIGILIGYLGQRSRYCSIAGIRDFYLVRDTYLIKGLIGLFLGALVTFTVFNVIGGDTPRFLLLLEPHKIATYTWILTIVGGFGLGFFSVLSDGCPFRHHVRAAEGKKTAISYLAGLYIGVIFFNLVVQEFIVMLFELMGL
jgi:uncharacterized membrane protein YedE/YeeE